MKTSMVLCAIIFLFLTGCNQQEADSTKHEPDSAGGKTEQTEHHSEMTLTLNEGKKWKLDEPTRTNINAAKQVFQQAVESSNQDYAALAANLQDNANKLVSECKMSGKDHDMLHVWLEHYLTTLKELKSSEAGTQKAAFDQIGEQLKKFDQYFE